VYIPGGGDVYVVNKDGTDMRVVTGDGSDNLVGWANDSQHVIYYEGEPGGAGGSYFAIRISDLTWTRLSGEVMERMCSYWNFYNLTIRSERNKKVKRCSLHRFLILMVQTLAGPSA